MKLIYTEQSYLSLEDVLNFRYKQGVSRKQQMEFIEQLFKKTNSLLKNPFLGQEEEYLIHLKLGHRRLLEGYCKIIYRVEKESIYITEFFDTRQDPQEMKSYN